MKNCPYCEEFLDGRNQINEDSDSNKKSKKSHKTLFIILGIIGVLIILGLIIFFVFNRTKKDTWQGIYYPVGLSHNDGEQTYGPIFENYKACEEWGLYLLENEKRASMCTSKCHGTAAGLPLCDKVVRSWKPFPSSEVYEGINIEKSDTDDLFNLFSDDNLENDEYDIDEYDIDEYDIDDYDVDDNKNNDDDLILLPFLLDTEDIYCGYKVLINNIIDGPKQSWYKQVMVNGDDVPSQRVLGQRLLNQMENQNMFNKKESYMKTYGDNKYFSDTVRKIGLVHDHIHSYLVADSKLKDFEEFKNIMLTDFTAATEALTSIPGTLQWEYDYFISENEKSNYKLTTKYDSDSSKNLIDIDSICNFSYNAVNGTN